MTIVKLNKYLSIGQLINNVCFGKILINTWRYFKESQWKLLTTEQNLNMPQTFFW